MYQKKSKKCEYLYKIVQEKKKILNTAMKFYSAVTHQIIIFMLKENNTS
jgi:hypothetical protein